MTTLRKRVFVSWSEFRGMAVADYEASETVDACRPVRADEVMVHSGTSGRHVIEPRIVLHSRRCGEVAVYRPGIGDDGRPFVQRIRSVVDGERCERGHRLCCPGRHECSLCVNDRREASMAKLTWEELADPDESWRRVLRRAKQLSEQRRAEVDGLEAAFNADAESPTGADSEDTAGRDSTLGETLMGDADE